MKVVRGKRKNIFLKNTCSLLKYVARKLEMGLRPHAHVVIRVSTRNEFIMMLTKQNAVYVNNHYQCKYSPTHTALFTK